MSAKPTKLPRWADVGGVIVEPTSGRKDVGWPVRYRPPAQIFNWLFNLIYLWLSGLDAIFGTNWSLTLPANEHVTVSGTGKFKHGTKTINIPVAGDLTSVSSTTLAKLFHVTLPVGARITAVRVRCADNATGPTILRMYLLSAADGIPTALFTPVTSSGSGAAQTLSQGSLTITIAASLAYGVFIEINSGAASCTAYWAEVDYDQP